MKTVVDQTVAKLNEWDAGLDEIKATLKSEMDCTGWSFSDEEYSHMLDEVIWGLREKRQNSKRVLQISFDVLVKGEVSGWKLAENVAQELEKLGIFVVGFDCTGDLTAVYRDDYGFDI